MFKNIKYSTNEIKKLNNNFDKWFNVLFTVLFVAVFIHAIVSSFIICKVQVDGESMEPTLKDGDKLYVSVISKVDYNDVIVIKVTDSEGEHLIIKRAIGLQGDEIEIKNGYVYRNGKRLAKDYDNFGYTDGYLIQGKITVGKNQVFYLGDNRDNSKDSRSEFGLADEDDVLGVVTKWSLENKYFLFWF